MKKFILAILVLLCNAAFSQNTKQPMYHIQVCVGGGLHSLLFNPQEGVSELGFGGLLDAQFQYSPFNDHRLMLGFGLQVSSLNSSATFNYTYKEHDVMLPSALYPCDYIVKFEDWREEQNIVMLCVPVQFIYKSPIIDNNTLIKAGLGFSLDLPIKASYEANGGSYVAVGHMQETNVSYIDDLGDYHLGNFPAKERGVNTVPLNVSVVGDLGIQFDIRRSYDLYVGAYINYGMLNSGRVIYHDIFSDYQYKGVLNSGHVSKANPLEFGVKVGVDLGWGEKKVYELPKNSVIEKDPEIQAAEDRARARATQGGSSIMDGAKGNDSVDIKRAEERARKRALSDTSSN